ncbi:f-box fbd lrr-repeat protein [Hordeum vulgare]|nr:f-box fbd lrr-repeat protein [Hordeum vulgare]
MLGLAAASPDPTPCRRADGCVSSSSVAKAKEEVCQDDDASPGGKRLRYSEPDLPEDIWHHIHSLLPLRDAARTACVSRTFLRSWSYHPHLIFNKHILGLNSKGCATDLIRTIDHVLKKHSGVNVKTLTLELYDFPEVANALCCQLDSWLEIAMRPGIEEINLLMRMTSAYKFPCRLLSDRIRKSIRCLKLFFCDFRPTVKLGPFKNLAMLCLCHVGLNEYDLVCLLSNTLALEQLELITIDKLEFLEIPYQLQRLSCLTVSFCWKLYVLEIKAPNLRIIKLDVPKVERLSLGVSVELKRLHIYSPGFTCYARSKLLSKVPNLDTLSLKLIDEVPPPDMLPSKFLRLKGLVFSLPGRAVSPSYDYFSLVSLLDSCPSLETLYLNVSHDCAGHGANSEDPSHPRQAPGQHHVGNLKSVTISGFCSATSLVELTCYFLEMAASLEHLTLNVHGEFYVLASGACMPMYKGMLTEAPRTLLAIRKYVQAKVPSTVKLNVSEPCGQ